jgi:hypothetical protein
MFSGVGTHEVDGAIGRHGLMSYHGKSSSLEKCCVVVFVWPN